MANPSNDLIYMTKDTLQYFAETILNAVNSRVEERIVTTIDAQSDNNHTPSAKAVYGAMNNIQQIVPLVIRSGDPEEADITPNTKTLYLVSTSASAPNFIPYIWKGEEVGFVPAAGATTEDSTDISTVSEQDIDQAVASAVTATAVL